MLKNELHSISAFLPIDFIKVAMYVQSHNILCHFILSFLLYTTILAPNLNVNAWITELCKPQLKSHLLRKTKNHSQTKIRQQKDDGENW